MKFNIHAIGLPGAAFADDAALHEHRPTAEKYESAVAGYERDRDDLLLHEDLAALGFDRSEIQWHLDNPGQRMRQGFAIAE